MPLSSGQKLCDKAVTLFTDMKMGSKSTRYFTLKVTEDSSFIDIEHQLAKTAEQEKDYECLMNELSDTCGRFILLDLQVMKTNGVPSDVMLCIMWNPDTSTAKLKMLYSTALKCVEDTLKVKAIQINSRDDMAYASILDKTKSRY